jgi:hypothetical protein
MAYVYRHVRLDTNKVFYVGIGSSCDYKRAKEKIGRNIYWKRIANKTFYRIDILLDEITPEEARIKEIEFISIYGRRDLGLGTLVNLTDGGDGACGVVVSDNTKRKISEKSKNRKANLGKVFSQEWKKNLSISGKGRKFSEEHRKKIGEANKKRIFTNTTREKHRQNNLGKKASEETKFKMSKNSKTKKSVIQKTLDDCIIKIYDSIDKAGKENKINPSGICRCCRGKYLTYGGYKWEYFVNIV